MPVRCSSRSAASTSTGTTTSRPPWRRERAPRSWNARCQRSRCPQLIVERSQVALASAAAWWYGDPSHELAVVGITGTDGKTTTGFLAVAALEAAGVRAGMIGTAAIRIGGREEPNEAHATTPDAPHLQAALRAMAAAGDRAAVVESTSHGLALERVGSVAYDVAILTNVTHEHLEFHGSWEAYRDAKLSLFERLGTGRAAVEKPSDRAWPRTGIVNLDDPSAGLFVGVTQEAGARVLTYGTDPAADVRATRVEEDASGLRIAYTAPSGAGSLALRLAGRFNVHNALAVVALGEAVGLDPEAVREGLAGLERGARAGWSASMRASRSGSSSTTRTARPRSRPCSTCWRPWRRPAAAGSSRSSGRPASVTRPSARSWAGSPASAPVSWSSPTRTRVTRTARPSSRTIARGAEAAGKRRDHDLLLIADRRAAIAAALERARPGDIVLLAGKGHERSIIGPGGPAAWDERTEAEMALRELGFG